VTPEAYWEPLPDCPHGIVRVYSDGDVPFGHPYDFCCTVIATSFRPYAPFDRADLRGLRTDGLTIRHQRAIFACLRDQGFDEVTWTRNKVQRDGTVKQRIIRCRLH
jgi:hypothetical protein